MAQRVQVLLLCDLHDDDTEVEGTETLTFGMEGASYEIDVCEQHAGQFRDATAAFVGAARKPGRAGGAGGSGNGRRSSSNGRRPSAGKSSVSEIREWARQNGHQVNERGRIASSVLEAYHAAH